MRSSFLCLLLSVLVLISSVSCHNWLGGAGRAALASTRYPWPVKIESTPHIQVGVNQSFVIEWSTGHGNILTLYNETVFSYFVVLKLEDQYKVPLTSAQMNAVVKEYLRDAPDSAYIYNTMNWDKKQLLPWMYNTNKSLNKNYWNNFNVTSTKYFVQNLEPGHPQYIPRPKPLLDACKSEAKGGQVCSLATPASQWLYKQVELSKDIRIEYEHPKYPWIESLHKFQTSVTETTFTNTYSSANFKISARKGPGNYMLWFLWRGYYDVVDVNVQPFNVTNPYGSGLPTSASTYTRIDHCEFNNFQNPATPCRVVSKATMDISLCLSDCDKSAGCEEVQVRRITDVSTTISDLPVNIPTTRFNSTQFTQPDGSQYVSGPCGYQTAVFRAQAGCKEVQPSCDLTKLVYQPGDYLCWGSDFILNVTLQATPAFTVVTEPEDPMFYSTCYYKGKSSGFLPFEPYPRMEPKWIAGDHCVDCKKLNATKNLPLNIAPNWEGTIYWSNERKCKMCDSDL